MLGWELLLILAVAGMFVLVVRRLPQALKTMKELESEEEPAPEKPAVPKPVVKEPTPSPEPAELKSAPTVSLEEKETLADQAYSARDFIKAQLLYQELVQGDDRNPKWLSRLGTSYLHLEKFHEARDAFRLLVKFEDGVANHHANLGMAEYGLGHRLTAIRYVKRAIALSPHTKRFIDLLETIESDHGSR